MFTESSFSVIGVMIIAFCRKNGLSLFDKMGGCCVLRDLLQHRRRDAGGVMKEKGIEGRIAWLDAARGIGILLIVLGHVIPMTTPISHFIYSFHVPLFFFISGMVLQKRSSHSFVAGGAKTANICENAETAVRDLGNAGQPFLNFIRRKAGSLLYPYVMFSVLSLVCDRLLDSLDRFGGNIPGTVLLLGDGPLWFLPALFIAEVLFYVVYSMYKHMEIRRYNRCSHAGSGRWGSIFHLTADAVLMAFSVWFSGRFYYAVADPDAVSLWSIGNVLNRGVVGFLWMELGWLLATIQEKDGLRTRTRNALAVLAMISSIFISGCNTYVDLHYSLLGNPALYFVGGFLAIYAVTQLCRQLPGRALRALAFWGRNSLIVFATHVNLRILLTAQGCMQRFDGAPQWLLIFLQVLLVEAVLVIFINWFAKWLISVDALRRALRERRMRFYIPLVGCALFLLAQYAKYLYMHASVFGQQPSVSVGGLTQPGTIPADVCLLLAIAVPLLAGRRLLHENEDENGKAGQPGVDEGSRAPQRRTPTPDSDTVWLRSSRGRGGDVFRLLIGNAIWFVAIYKTTELFWSGSGCILIGGVIVLLLTAAQSKWITLKAFDGSHGFAK